MSTIPKEAEPDVKIPIVYVQLTQRGISPEDAERLLLRPVETQLKSVGNVKEMRSTAFEGGGYVLLEFEAGFDSKSRARRRARQGRSGQARPAEATPTSRACRRSTSRSIPVLVVALVRRRAGAHAAADRARRPRTRVEQVPGVLSAELRGARDEAVEIIAEPMLMKSYGISLDQLIVGFNAVQQPGRGRRARRRDRPLRREGAGADRDGRRTC